MTVSVVPPFKEPVDGDTEVTWGSRTKVRFKYFIISILAYPTLGTFTFTSP